MESTYRNSQYSIEIWISLTCEQVSQVLLLDGENTGKDTGSIRDARELVITDEQFQAFLDRHKHQASLVPESNEVMKDSCLLLDEEMRYVAYLFLLVPMTSISVAGS